MPTKTIPEYLEDERGKRRDAQLRMGEEAARIHLVRHGHHRTAKQPKLELPPPVDAADKARQTAAAARKKPPTRRGFAPSRRDLPRNSSCKDCEGLPEKKLRREG